MSAAVLRLAFIAGLLSILSPCVLPLIPIVFGTAASEHRFGPAALAAGVTLSFVAIGLFVATIGFSIGIDGGAIRTAGAVMLVLAGLVSAMPSLQARVALAGGPVADWADSRIRRFAARGLAGQFGVGVLLGAVWSPCAGPTLGAASVLAAQGGTVGAAALTMTSFGFGAALPLAVVGLASRAVFARWRGTVLSGGKTLKTLMGLLLVVLGAAILSGLDRSIEAGLVATSPDWLLRLTTSF
jgi:cytochrome c biogenesis protein CcdA